MNEEEANRNIRKAKLSQSTLDDISEHTDTIIWNIFLEWKNSTTLDSGYRENLHKKLAAMEDIVRLLNSDIRAGTKSEYDLKQNKRR